jgi:ketosteroid isomerase-like protein
MRSILIVIILMTMLVSCDRNDKGNLEKWKQEIVRAENDFSLMAKEKGIPEAFLAFSADSVVIMRNNKLIKGRDALRSYFSENSSSYLNNSLDWAPDFVEVSASGDLAYTYGRYTFTYRDSLGNKVENKGIFHTVWKRQPGGEWKFVWD